MNDKHEIGPRCFKAHSYRKKAKKLGRKLFEAEKSKGQAYWERNQLVALLSKMFPSWLEKHPEEDKDGEDDWRNIVFIQMPQGQASWHFHDSDLEFFNHLEHKSGNSWDGHTTKEKYERLMLFKPLTNI